MTSLTSGNETDENGNAVFFVGANTCPLCNKKIFITNTVSNYVNAKASLHTGVKSKEDRKEAEKKKKCNQKRSNSLSKRQKTNENITRNN